MAPKKGRPKPQEVGQVVHGDQQAAPPPHLIRPDDRQLQATNPLHELQKLGADEDQENEQHLGGLVFFELVPFWGRFQGKTKGTPKSLFGGPLKKRR